MRTLMLATVLALLPLVSVQAEPDLAVLEACAANEAASLPNPFTDLAPTDWAYSAVLTMYYCGAYRGAISPQQYYDYLSSTTAP